MSRLLVYPVNRKSSSFARYRNLICEFDSVVCVVARGNGYNKKNACILDNGKVLDIILTEDYEAELDLCDTVLFLDTEEYLSINLYYEKICNAEKCGKKVLLCKSVDNSLRQAKLAMGNNVRVIGENSDLITLIERSCLKKMDVPVIAVLGMGSTCNKFDLQLDLKDYFQHRGFKVLSIGTKEFSELFGMYNLPDYIFDSKISLTEKILRLNDFFYEIIRKKKPDICIIGIPGGIMPLDNYFYNDFAEIPYIITNAIKADISILSTYYFPAINDDFFSNLSEHIKHKFGYIIDYFHISNVAYSIDTSDDVPEISYLHNDYKKVEEIIKNNNFTTSNVFNVFSDQRYKLYKMMEDELSSNLEII